MTAHSAREPTPASPSIRAPWFAVGVKAETEPYSIGWKNHRQRIVADGVTVNERDCYRCGQPWPCEVAQAFEAGYQRGLQQADED